MRTSAGRRRVPLEDFGPLDVPPPDAEHDSGYYKTRVETIFGRRLWIQGFTESTWTLWLTDEQMLRSAAFDARDGVLFVRVDAEGELSASLDVQWEIPGTSVLHSYLTAASLPLSDVERVVAWSGPVPGRVCIVLRINNLGPSTRGRVRIDLCARRHGGNFEPGMWLRDVEALTHVSSQLPDYDPDPERERQRSPRAARDRRRRCAEWRRPRSPSPLLRVHPREVQARVREEAGLPANDAPVGEPPCAEYTPDCDPDASAVDWIANFESASGRTPAWSSTGCARVPDPEVVAAVNAGLLDDVTLERGQAYRRNNVKVNLPNVLAGIVDDLSDPTTYLGRCEGFDALWATVSRRLDADRMSVRNLQRILTCGVLDNAGGGALLKVPASHIAYEDLDDTGWNWKTPAPWLHEDYQVSWFLVTMLNILQSTLELAPSKIKSPRKNRKTRIMRRSRSGWRLRSDSHPYLNIRITRSPESGAPDEFIRMVSEESGFDIRTCSWTAVPEYYQEDIPSTKAARTNPIPVPAPSLINLKVSYYAPLVRAAAETYATARLLTMIAARYRTQLDARGQSGPGPASLRATFVEVQRTAETYYRLHLGVMARACRVLVHELYHLWESEDDVAINLGAAIFTRRGVFVRYAVNLLAKSSHCHTGCGQDRMAAGWQLEFSKKYECGWPQVDDEKAKQSLPLRVALHGEEDACVQSYPGGSCDPPSLGLTEAWYGARIDYLGSHEATLSEWMYGIEWSSPTVKEVVKEGGFKPFKWAKAVVTSVAKVVAPNKPENAFCRQCWNFTESGLGTDAPTSPPGCED